MSAPVAQTQCVLLYIAAPLERRNDFELDESALAETADAT